MLWLVFCLSGGNQIIERRNYRLVLLQHLR